MTNALSMQERTRLRPTAERGSAGGTKRIGERCGLTQRGVERSFGSGKPMEFPISTGKTQRGAGQHEPAPV